jgi:hypothetical protein
MQMFRRFVPTGPPLFAAAIALAFFAASSASAITVKYSTSFDFDAGAGVSNSVNILDQNPATGLGNVIGTFTFNGAVNQTVNTPDLLTAVFGSISYSSAAGAGEFGSVLNVPFDMTVTETQPGGGDTSTNHFSGSVNFDGSLATVIFTGGPLTIGSVTYTPTSTSMVFMANGTVVGGNNSILGSVTSTAVPLPAAAWGGMALFGLLGGNKLRRMRRLSSAL